MTEKLPASTKGENYRYESRYATPSTATTTAIATEASSGLYRYSAAVGVGAGGVSGAVSVVGGLKGAAYHVAAVPAEFGGTLKSNKGSGGVGGGGDGRSPHKQQKRKKEGAKNSYNGNYCGCFGRSGRGGGAGVSDGVAARWQASFWPALLANIGICALLLGYVFIGSFVFLTIENSGRNAAATTHVDDAAAMWQFAAQKSQAQETRELLKQQGRDQQLQQHEDHQHQPQRMTSATWQAANKRHINEDNATTRVELATTTTTTTTGNTQLGTRNISRTGIDVEASYIDTSIHDKRQRRWQEQPRARPRPQNNDYDELHTLSMRNDGEGADAADEYGDVELPPGALAAVEDVERQRTVENIWEITVSLNILYKENWTKLAALEIQKFQDQLVKRLAMDLTLSSSAEARSRDPNRLHAVTMHHQDAKQYKGHHQQHRSHYPDLHTYEGVSGRGEGGRGGERRPRKLGGYQSKQQQRQFEWNFATAFLYSLTVITTVGYGSISPRSTLGRMVTIGYATIGIPLTLIYLSSIGAILAKLARLLCTQALCCCFCVRRQRSCCCCYSALHAPTKERELKLNRLRQQQQESIKMRAQQQQQHLAYCYVRPPAITAPHSHSQQQQPPQLQLQDITASSVAASDLLPHMLDASLDTLSVATTTPTPRVGHTNPFGWSLLAPIALCLLLMLCYVAVGAVAVALLEDWPLLDGVYFCFMSLTTIGFCDLLPGVGSGGRRSNTSSIWFCSAYILSGLTLTAMCVNVLHEEVLLRMRVVVKFKKVAAKETKERSFYGAPP